MIFKPVEFTGEYTTGITYKEEYVEELKEERERLTKENKILKESLGIKSPSKEMLEGKYWETKEIERLNNIIEQTQKILYIKLMNENKEKIYIQEVIDIIENLKGSDKE